MQVQGGRERQLRFRLSQAVRASDEMGGHGARTVHHLCQDCSLLDRQTFYIQNKPQESGIPFKFDGAKNSQM